MIYAAKRVAIRLKTDILGCSNHFAACIDLGQVAHSVGHQGNCGNLSRLVLLEAIPKPEVTMAIVILGCQQGASTGDRAGSPVRLKKHS
jgi:hypothetical protein